jgi:hypothetical protein
LNNPRSSDLKTVWIGGSYPNPDPPAKKPVGRPRGPNYKPGPIFKPEPYELKLNAITTIEDHVKALIQFYEGAREASRETRIGYSYLRELRNGTKSNPGPRALEALGLRAVGKTLTVYKVKRLPK